MNLMTTDPVLSLSGVSRTFDEHHPVISNVSFDLSHGETVSVVGPSGCGKSTLLRMIAGLDTPTTGTIINRAVRTQMLFQEPALLPWRTLRRNVELNNDLHKSLTQRSTVDEILRSVGLLEHADKYPHQLSGGMKMRTSLARALSTDSDLLLLDEPFSAIDELTRESLNDLLLSTQRQWRFASLFVTHNIAEAMYLSDRIIVLSPTHTGESHINAIIDVTLPDQRTPAIRYTSEFHTLCHSVHSALRDMHS